MQNLNRQSVGIGLPATIERHELVLTDAVLVALPARPQIALRLRLELPNSHRVAETSGGLNFSFVLPSLAVDVVKDDERLVVVDRRVKVLLARLEGVLHALLIKILARWEEAIN